MDKIHIKDLEIYAYHGVNPEENRLGQKFLFTLELSTDFSEAAQKDDIEKSVNYAEVCKFVESLITENQFKLIETCADTVARGLLRRFPSLEKARVLLKKPWAPIGSHLDYAGVEDERGWHTAYIGLGSNLGDKKNNLDTAIRLLDNEDIRVLSASSYYETKPVGYLEQDMFLNCAVKIKTLLRPKELLKRTQKIEGELKRKRDIHWGPRTIDLDILFYGENVSADKDLVLPHPEIQNRLFVLCPLAEIEPYLVHPLLQKRIVDLKNELEKTQEL